MSNAANRQEVVAMAHAAAALYQAGYRWVGGEESLRCRRVAEAMVRECEAALGCEDDDA